MAEPTTAASAYPVAPRRAFNVGRTVASRYRLARLITPEAAIFFAPDLRHNAHVVVQAVFAPEAAPAAPRLTAWLKAQPGPWIASNGLAVLDMDVERTSNTAFVVLPLVPELPVIGYVHHVGLSQSELQK